MKSISLLNVSFAYSGCDDLFHDLSIAFHDTGTVAIVGDNGCGKSTLLKLLAGQLSADSGRVISNAVVEYLPQMTPHGDKSGGQHQMVELMRVLNSNANIVLLDEPTNNLDIKSTAILESALAQYQGAILLVSHDNDFVKNVNMNKFIAL